MYTYMRRGSWRKVASVGGRQLGLCVYCVRFTNGHCDLLNALSLHTEVDYDYERLLQKLLGSPSEYHNIVK